jgi:hypothetical protein
MTKGGNNIFHNFEKQLIVKKVKRKLATKTARAMVTLSHYRCFQYFVESFEAYLQIGRTCSLPDDAIHSRFGQIPEFIGLNVSA